MARNHKAKKKADVRAKYLISDKQLEKIKYEVSKEATSKASLLCICAMADHLHMDEEQICDVAETITRYAMYLDENKIRISQIAEIIKNETGIEFKGFQEDKMNRYEDINDLPERYRQQAERKLNRRASANRNGKSKYGNKVSEINGIKFDSKKEGRRYLELLDKFKSGEISDLRLQTQFTLIEGFKTPTGENVKPERYIADFTYFENGQFVVEDVKSEATRKKDVYCIKKKQMLDIYGIQIKEV